MSVLPRYPVYVPSKGRSECPFTPRRLKADGVPFHLVVEPGERDKYGAEFEENLLVLPWDGDDEVRRKFCAERGIENGGLVAVRNWIKERSVAAGDERHWQIDDNIRHFRRWGKTPDGEIKRLYCEGGVALRVVEDFSDRYENVAISGLNYTMFAQSNGRPHKKPFFLNVHVYSCTLVLNSIPNRWRLAYNDDTDICLQVLADGWCTVLVTSFMCDKMQTMVVKGGNTDDLYQGDGRLKMTRSLARLWPGTVSLFRRWKRPAHAIKGDWRKFDTPLKRKAGLKIGSEPNEYGMKLADVEPENLPPMRSAGKSATPKPKKRSTGIVGSAKGHPEADIEPFLARCAEIGCDAALIRNVAAATLNYLTAGKGARAALRPNQELERRWYDGLNHGDVDFGVYGEDAYLGDLWACWLVYSRKYLAALSNPKGLPRGSILQDLGEVRRVADLGCGFGYTTAALCRIFADAEVVGTNLSGTTQTKIARKVGKDAGFKVVQSLKLVGQVDFVLASEYFEHFEEPLAHLRDVLSQLQPLALFIANTFGSQSIGHFNVYLVDGQRLPGKATSRAFNDALRAAGYVKQKTSLWNDRPTYWKREVQPHAAKS